MPPMLSRIDGVAPVLRRMNVDTNAHILNDGTAGRIPAGFRVATLFETVSPYQLGAVGGAA